MLSPTSPQIDNEFGARPHLYRRLVFGTVVAGLLLLIALASWLVWRQHEEAKAKAASDLGARAVLAATVFDTYFTGQMTALEAIASSPPVVATDAQAMTDYFARFRPSRSTAFPAGVGWIDPKGVQRATSDPRGPTALSLASRSYFREVIETRKPFVGEAIVARSTGRRIVVMSVPTRDRAGRFTGVLAGGLVLQPASSDSRATELGYEGLEIIDRLGQRLSRQDLAPMRNQSLLRRVRDGEGVIVGTEGLDGSADHVVAYASSDVPGWTAVLDQPEAAVFASARQSLKREAAFIAATSLILLGFVAWALQRARRDALSRMRRFQQEHEAVVLLQQSLLPTESLSSDNVDAAAHYQAGVANTNVGGDWYDVVRRPDGIVHMTVGDVAGRGIEAAVTMGQLRNAFRAYALDHSSPGAIIERMSRHVPNGGMATMVCVAYDPLTSELTYAHAGHPPPLLVAHAGAHHAQLNGSGSGPLGWVRTQITDGRLVLASDSTLALYTDGLVERRNASLDDNITRLGEAVLRHMEEPREDALRAIVIDLAAHETDDDLALLLARLKCAPARVELDLSADPSVLKGFRRRLRAWLESHGMDESGREDTVLAASEACNNAIEHAYIDGTGLISLCLESDGERVEIRVADSGTWRTPVHDPTRGRGRMLMTGLMDRAEIIQRPDGTEVVLARSLVG